MLSLLYFILFIAVFISGMALLRSGLYNLSADSFKLRVAEYADTPLKGLLSGIIVTALLHSSSAVMVITIGLISAGILTFSQSIGIILGANIGTTFTVEFITFNIDFLIVPLAVIGSLMILISRKNTRYTGTIFLGIAAVFAAMRGFAFLAGPLTDLPLVQAGLLMMNSSHFWSVLAGTALTAVIQSSTALTGIVMGFLEGDILTLEAGIAAMLGANIGTCITAYLASVGAGREARLTAFAHIWLNVLGVAVFYPFIHVFAVIAPLTAAAPEVQLAHASVIFNVLSSLLVFPFATRFGSMILFIHGRHIKD